MKLAELGFITAKPPVVFVGKFEPTGILSSNDEEYFKGTLKQPVIVHCSVDKEIEPIETDELFIRESDVNSDLWEAADGTDPNNGITIPGFKTDFSKGQEICIFQETTIAKWTKENRTERGKKRTSGINESIREKMRKRAEAKKEN